MKKYFFTAAILILASAMQSCAEKQDTEIIPEISIEITRQTPDSLFLKIHTENAEDAAYVFAKDGSEIPENGEGILSAGEEFIAEEPIVRTLEPDTDYIIAAAAVSKTGQIATDRKTITAVSAPQPEIAEETFSKASIVYNEDGSAVFTLSGGNIYGTISMLEADCILGNSHMPAAGDYPIGQTALLGPDNEIPAGSIFSISREGGTYALSVTSSRDIDGKGYRGIFSGGIDNAFELREANADYDFAACTPTWNENTLELIFSEGTSKGQLSGINSLFISIECPEHILPAGEYKIGESINEAYATISAGNWEIGYDSGSITVEENDGIFSISFNLAESYDRTYSKNGKEAYYDGAFAGTFSGRIEGVNADDPRNGTIFSSAEVSMSADYLYIDLFPETPDEFSVRLRCEFLSETARFDEGNYAFASDYGCYIFMGDNPMDMDSAQYFLMGCDVGIDYDGTAWTIHVTGNYFNDSWETVSFEGWFEGESPALDMFKPSSY